MERMTEKELARIKQMADDGVYEEAWHGEIQAVVAEVRRLRGLIYDAAGMFVGGPGACMACLGTLPEHHPRCPATDLLAERKAIRSEQEGKPQPDAGEPRFDVLLMPGSQITRVYVNGQPFIPERDK